MKISEFVRAVYPEAPPHLFTVVYCEFSDELLKDDSSSEVRLPEKIVSSESGLEIKPHDMVMIFQNYPEQKSGLSFTFGEQIPTARQVLETFPQVRIVTEA